jgi:hypothetical protein
MSSVIIYSYYNTDVANYNLDFFIKNELKYRENIDYIFVINGFYYDEKICFPEISNLTILRRENVGFDFGAYNCGIEYLESYDKKYDYYFFINNGVIGPIIPHYVDVHWSKIFIRKINDIVKLVGTSIKCLPPYGDPGGFGPKVEGFFFVVDQIGLDLLKNENTIFCDHDTKCSTILYGEYGLSKCILKHGYSIDCMIRKYQGIDWRNKDNWHLNSYRPSAREKSFYGYSIIPYELIFYKWFWRDDDGITKVNFEMIEQYVNNNT